MCEMAYAAKLLECSMHTPYFPPSLRTRTCVNKMAWFKSSISGLSRPIEHFVKERYHGNAEKASCTAQHCTQAKS